MSLVEWIATVLGVLCVTLGVVRSVWTFPTAIGSVSLLAWVVWQQRLYSDAVLQGFFVLANLYGWANWQRAAPPPTRTTAGWATSRTPTRARRCGAATRW